MTRNEAYLTVVEGWLRNNRGIHFPDGAVDDLCDRIAAEIERLYALLDGDAAEIMRLLREVEPKP